MLLPDRWLSFTQMLEDSNQRESKLYKWACIDGGEFRFIEVIYGENHGMLVNEGEKVRSAGTITVNNDYWRVMEHGSTTLHVGCLGSDEASLEMAFQTAGRGMMIRGEIIR